MASIKKRKIFNLHIEVGHDEYDCEIIEIPISPKTQREILKELNRK